ncbi:MAG: hypothetical protein KDL10_11065 [Kiritimatiellae bacterium]|nr:hypothetical protein [Kiritimatiellia bacterium]
MTCLQGWLIFLAISGVGLAGGLSLMGSWLTGGFLKKLEATEIPVPGSNGKGSGTEPPMAVSAITVVDLDLQLEHLQRGRCIVQAALLIFAGIALLCATSLSRPVIPRSNVVAGGFNIACRTNGCCGVSGSAQTCPSPELSVSRAPDCDREAASSATDTPAK